MIENVIVKEYELNKPLIQKIDSLIDNSIRECHHNYFHTFGHLCEYDIKFENNGNNETVNFTISDKSMCLYDLIKKSTVGRERCFIFSQIRNFKIKGYSNLSHIIYHYTIKLQIPKMHRQFLRKLSQNPEYIQTHWID